MKFFNYVSGLIVLIFVCGSGFSEIQVEQKENAKRTADKKPAKKKKKIDVAEEPEIDKKSEEIKKSFTYSCDEIRDYLVLIEHENGTGSGFVAKMGDKYYIITNQHVIYGAKQIKFKTISGKSLHPQKVEVSRSLDIARLLLSGVDEGLVIADKVKMGGLICVFGNSDGAGVVTEIYGKVNGIGGDLLEVSAGFVSGNSGSPVLDLNKEVVGVASYVRFSRSSRIKKGTRFNKKSRRFCYRLGNSEWIAINWKEYNKKYGNSYQENGELIHSLWDVYLSLRKHRRGSGIGPDRQAYPMVLSWVKSYNRKVDREERIASVSSLGRLCRGRAKKLNKFLKYQNRNMSGFLVNEFRQQSEMLQAFSEYFIAFSK